MKETSLTEKVEFERIGELRQEPGDGKYWILFEGLPPFKDRDVIKRFLELGYKVGDTVKYKIVVEPKE